MPKPFDLGDPTMLFALNVTAFSHALPDTMEGRLARARLFRAATGVAAKCRAAGRGRSNAELVARLRIVVEDADESGFWLEFSVRSALVPRDAAAPLLREAEELVRVFVSAQVAARQGR